MVGIRHAFIGWWVSFEHGGRTLHAWRLLRSSAEKAARRAAAGGRPRFAR